MLLAILDDRAGFVASAGRFERAFVNSEIWRGPSIDLVYQLKIIDASGRESNAVETTIRPR